MSDLPYTLDDLKYLMGRLREPGSGCPWDLKQRYATIAPSTIEEAYEVVDAIERQDYHDLREELGDLLFQVIYYCQFASEEERFGFDEVVSELVAKLLRRHPHVFPDGTLASRISGEQSEAEQAAIKQRWEALKREERAAKGKTALLDDVPLTLPALTRASKLQKRAASVGFDCQAIDGVLEKLEEELAEVREALQSANRDAIEDELGDLLFVVVNACRHAGLEPETTLRRANRKFESRFRYIEDSLSKQGVSLDEASVPQMEALWHKAKQVRKRSP